MDIKDLVPDNDESEGSGIQAYIAQITPEFIGKKIAEISPEVWSLEEDQLISIGEVGITERRLRVTFWLEFERSIRTNTNMQAKNIYAGVCHIHVLKRILKDPFKLAFISTQPLSHKIAAQECLYFATQEVRNILTKSHMVLDKEGKETKFLNEKVARLKFDIYQYLYDQAEGSPVKRQANFHKHEKSSSKGDAGEEEPKQMKDIDAQIKDLENKLGHDGSKG